MAVLAAVVRGLLAPLAAASSATSGSTSTARSSTSCCPYPLVVAAILGMAGRAADLRRACHGEHVPAQRETEEIARSPVASQEAIKNLSMDGGGFYNANSAVPFEDPNGFSNFLELLSLLLIPVAQVFMFGRMVLARRHAWAVLAAMDGAVRRRPRPSSPSPSSTAPPVLRASGVDLTGRATARAAAT